MKSRLFVVSAIVFVLIAAFSYIALMRGPSISVTTSSASLFSGTERAVSVYFELENPGEADVLLSAKSAFATRAAIIRPEPFSVTAIPARSSPVFSSDSVFLALSGLREDLKPGDLVPVTLSFQNAGEVNFKATILEKSFATMDHSNHNMAVPMGEGPAPQISISAARAPDGPGWRVDVTTENFTFIETQGDAPHVPGQGHAHVYLNGLKLQRLYGQTAFVGDLLPGTYTVTVSLNSNTHMVYQSEGRPVSADASITSD